MQEVKSWPLQKIWGHLYFIEKYYKLMYGTGGSKKKAPSHKFQFK